MITLGKLFSASARIVGLSVSITISLIDEHDRRELII
jgi:hypothetical protein